MTWNLMMGMQPINAHPKGAKPHKVYGQAEPARHYTGEEGRARVAEARARLRAKGLDA